MPKTSKIRGSNPGKAGGLSGNLTDIRAAKKEWFNRLLKRRTMPAARALTAPITPDPS